MDPTIMLIVLTALVVSGVWGSIIISSLLKRRGAEVESGSDDPRIEALQDDFSLLASRFEQLEEEVSFFRELHKAEDPGRLPSGDDSEPDG